MTRESAALIPLTQGKVALVDACDHGELSKYTWIASTGPWGTYALRRVGRTTVPMHRQILSAPRGMEVDHINGDTLDNRRSNLRSVTTRQNQANRHVCHSSSGYRGVYMHRGKYMARIRYRHDGKRTNICVHVDASAIESAIAYDIGMRVLHGDCANPNVPSADLSSRKPLVDKVTTRIMDKLGHVVGIHA